MRRDRRGCRSPWRGDKEHDVQITGVTCGSRGRTAQGPSNAADSHSVIGTKSQCRWGVCKPLIRRVRSAGVKATVHRCDSLLMCVLFIAHQAAGSHNAQAFRTPFQGASWKAIWRGELKEKPARVKWRALEP